LPPNVKMKILRDYDKENDILYINFGEVKESIKLDNGQTILDTNKKGEVIGIEIFDYKKRIGGGKEWKKALSRLRSRN